MEILRAIGLMVATACVMAFTSALSAFGVYFMTSGGLVDVLFGGVLLFFAMKLYLEYGTWVSKWIDKNKQGEGSNV